MALWDHFQRGSQGRAALARRQPHVRASVFFQQDRLHDSLDRRVERQRLRGGRRGRNRRRDVRLPASQLRMDSRQRRITAAPARPSTGSLPRPFHGETERPASTMNLCVNGPSTGKALWSRRGCVSDRNRRTIAQCRSVTLSRFADPSGRFVASRTGIDQWRGALVVSGNLVPPLTLRWSVCFASSFRVSSPIEDRARAESTTSGPRTMSELQT